MESDEGRPAERSRWDLRKPNRGSPPSSQSFKSWLSGRWSTVLILVAIIFLALFVRSVFGYSTSVDGGFLIAGGYDAYLNQHIIEYINSQHSHLLWDEAFNYPFGMNNPIPPLYDWSVAITGQFVSAITGMAVNEASAYALLFSSAIWGALACIPIFLIGKTLVNRRTGLIAAFFYAIMAGSVIKTVFSEADYFGMALFFATFALYFMIRSLQSAKGSKVVGSWTSGIKEHLDDRRSIIFAVLAGTCLAAVAFMWTGYTYLVSIILIYFLVQAFINRFKNLDISGEFLSMVIMLGVTFLFIAPVYYQLDFMSTFTPAFLLFLGTIVIGLIAMVSKDLPWVLSIPVMLIVLVAGLLAIKFIWPGMLSSVLFGVDYSLFNNISLVNESFSKYVLSFGAITFWLALIGAAWAVLKIRKSTSSVLVFATVATLLSMYLATVSSGFIYLATPVFAIASAWVLGYIIDKLHFENISRNLVGFWSNPLHNLRKVFNLKHVVGVVFVIILLVPNAWGAVDAAIPYSDKADYDEGVFNSMPDLLHPSGIESYDDVTGLWYLGAFSYYLTLSDSYLAQALEWLSQQDIQIVNIGDKPAVMVWNGYGPQVVQNGSHPVLSSEMYSDAEFTSAFLTAKSEEEGIALLAIRALEYDYEQHNGFSEEVKNILGGDLTQKLTDIFEHPSNYIKTVLDDPETYGHRTNDLSATNAKYAVASHELATSDDLIKIYSDLKKAVDVDFGYFMFDSSVFPLGYQSQGMLYVAASLSDYVLDSYTGAPTDFYTITAYVYNPNTSQLMMVDAKDIPAGYTVLSYGLSYTDTFYNSILYKSFMGSSGNTGNPGWGLAHFKYVYQTAYYNPYDDEEGENYDSSWRIISLEEAKNIQEKIDAGEWKDPETGEVGKVDLNRYPNAGGAVILEYYDGAVLKGTVTSQHDGVPLEGVHVSAVDENGIVHQTVETDEKGEYTLHLPYGDSENNWEGVDVVFSIGDIDSKTGLGSVELDRMEYRVTYKQAMWEEEFSENGDTQLYAAAVSGKLFWDLDGNGRFDGNDEVIANTNVTLSQPDPSDSSKTKYTSTFETDEEGNYAFVAVPGDDYKLSAKVDGHEYTYSSSFSVKLGSNFDLDIAVKALTVSGTVKLENNAAAQNVSLALINTSTGKIYSANTDSKGAFTFEKVPNGTYKLIAPGMDVGTQVVEVNSQPVTGLELTVREYVTVSGNISGGETNKTLWIESKDGTYSSMIETTGSYTATLPKDMEFSVYAYSGDKAYMGKLSTKDFSGKYDITLGDAVKYEGVVNYNGNAQEDATLIFMNSNGAYHATTADEDGKYSIVLPNGKYTVYAAANGKSYWGGISDNIKLTDGMNISGTVKSGNTAVPGATVSVTKDGKTIFTTTDGEGKFSLPMPSGDYKVKVQQYGYTTYEKNIKAGDGSMSISLSAEKVLVSGKVTGAPADTSINFKPSSGSSETVKVQENGTYSVELAPGKYTVTVEREISKDQSKYYFSASLEVSAGAYVVYDIDVPTVYNTTVELSGVEKIKSGSIKFFGNEDKSVSTGSSLSSSVYLTPGQYVVYASVTGDDNKHYAAITSINVSSSGKQTVSLSEATEVTGSLKGSSETVTATITDGSGHAIKAEIEKGTLNTVYLPRGNYNISLAYHALDSQSGKYVQYSADQSFTVAGSKVSLDINLTTSDYLAHVSGTTNMNWTNYQIIALSSTAAERDNYNVQFSDGKYSVDLAPGLYSLYALNGNNVYMGTFEVSADGDNNFNVTLEPGKSVAIHLNGAPGGATVTVSDNAKYRINNASGTTNVVLPNGEYMVEAVVQNSSGNITNVYSGYAGFVVGKDSGSSVNVNLQLQKYGSYKVDVGTSKTVNPGGTVTFDVTITNTGNVEDTYQLTTTAGEKWEISIDRETVTLAPGTSTTVKVTIKTPENALVDHDPVMFNVKSLGKVGAGESSTELDLIVNPSYKAPGVTIEQVTTNGSTVKFNVKVENTGNTTDSYKVELLNKSEIESAGWTVKLDSEKVSDLEAGKVKTVVVTLERGENARNDVSVNVRVTSESDSSKVTNESARMSTADLAVDGKPTTEGSGASVSAPAMPNSMWVVIALIVLLLVAIVISNVNKGVFGRRRKR